jgi:SAM-dependent methyltransferase
MAQVRLARRQLHDARKQKRCGQYDDQCIQVTPDTLASAVHVILGRMPVDFERALRTLPLDNEAARPYLEKHLPRLVKTLELVPQSEGGRALELGCYMQITPFLQRICGYREVRGAYYGKAGKQDRKTMSFPDGDFTCLVDHFDAERDPFPYPEGYFDLVLATEIVEHMAYDPMHLFVESGRVLCEGGRLLVSTPNAASFASIAKALDGRTNPQIFPQYKRPDPMFPEIGHVHEYTAHELRLTLEAAGFEIERLFTTTIEEYALHAEMLKPLLEALGYEAEDRGEQTWCLAAKRGELRINRYPEFLYSE